MVKKAFVTGGTRNIGRAISFQLAADGFDLFVNYRSNDDAAREFERELQREYPGTSLVLLKGDVSSEEDMINAFKAIAEGTNTLDLLVNNAGYDDGRLIEDMDINSMRKVVDINLISVFINTKLALQFLKNSDNPKIINISSRMGGDKYIPTIGAYGPAKAGVIKFTKLCSLEFAKYKIRCNSVSPGLTKTTLTEAILSDEEFAGAANANPNGRNGTSGDVAHVVSFLASERADHVNAEDIRVDGGSFLV